MDTHGEKTGIFAKKGLWIGVGTGLFILIAFIWPTPQSLIEVMEKYGYVQKMIDWEIAHNAKEASAKTMIVLGIVPMAVVFFAVEALPIGVTGILMPLMAYFFGLLPFNMIGKTFAGDAPMFMLGVFALGATVVEVGFHKRLAVWLLGWTKGFWVPMIVLCLSMSIVGSFMSAPAMCSFMVPVMMAVYYGSVKGHQPGGGGGSRSGSGQISAFFPLLRPEYGRTRNTLGRWTQCDHDGFLYRIRHTDHLFRLDAIRLAPGAARQQPCCCSIWRLFSARR